MTVKELIERLKEYPEDQVVCSSDNEAGYFEITRISEEPIEDSPYISNSTNFTGKMVVLL